MPLPKQSSATSPEFSKIDWEPFAPTKHLASTAIEKPEPSSAHFILHFLINVKTPNTFGSWKPVALSGIWFAWVAQRSPNLMPSRKLCSLIALRIQRNRYPSLHLLHCHCHWLGLWYWTAHCFCRPSQSCCWSYTPNVNYIHAYFQFIHSHLLYTPRKEFVIALFLSALSDLVASLLGVFREELADCLCW